jgi:hypothetical protein
MDTRALLLGLGSGIIAATVVIGAGDVIMPKDTTQPVAPAPEQQNPATPAPATDWQKAAQEAGMVVLSKQDFDQKLAQAKTEGANAKEAELANKPAPPPAAPTTVRVYIQNGMGTKDVGNLLKAAGVIANVDEFVAARQNHNSPIRAGIYELRLNSTPQEVFKVVATPP